VIPAHARRAVKMSGFVGRPHIHLVDGSKVLFNYSKGGKTRIRAPIKAAGERETTSHNSINESRPITEVKREQGGGEREHLPEGESHRL